MSNINKQTQDLYNIELVQDLDHEDAATVSGGYLYLSTGYNGTGAETVYSGGDRNLYPYNNTASWYKVTGSKGWYAYTGKNYTGTRYYLRPYSKGNLYGYENNNFESVRPA